jgi:DHA2 family lincomycin resistance protein-like MFS transporter
MATETIHSDAPSFTPPQSFAAADPAITKRNNLVINLLLVSAFVVILNETIMSVALPRLMADLDVPASAAQWLTTAFLLTMAVVIPVTGFLLQRFHTRPIFVLAMSLFSLGTLTAALSPNLPFLIIARVIQASGTAVMMPLLMTTVMTLVPPHERGKKMGNISIVISVAPAIGPFISGLILSVLDWRWMFIIVLPIALAALALGYRLIVNVTEPRRVPLDVLSVIVSALAFGGIVYGLSNLGEPSGSGLPAWMPLVVGLLAMAVFVWRQIRLQKTDSALLELRTFSTRNFTVSVILMAVAMMALFGTIILLPIYLQNVLGLTTLQTGLMLLPGGVLMGVLAPTVGKLYDKIGPRPLLLPGLIIVSAVLWALTLVGTGTPWFVILGGHIVLSLGFALMFTPLFTVSLSSVEPRYYSHGSAIVGSIQQVAGAAGVAVFVALMTSRAADLAATGTPQLEALAAGIRTGFLVGAIISLFAIIAALFIRKPDAMPEGAPMMGGH